MTLPIRRVDTKAQHRLALLDAARDLVGRQGYGVRLDDIAGQAGLTTGAVYSVFGSKDNLLLALIVDDMAAQEQAVACEAGGCQRLEDAVRAYARTTYRASAGAPGRRQLRLDTQIQDMALRDPRHWEKLRAGIQAQVAQLAALFAGRFYNDAIVTQSQALRLARALGALVSGLRRARVLGLEQADEALFIDAAVALAAPCVLDASADFA